MPDTAPDPQVITTRTGTMLVPGVSRNGRLYTPEVIGKAVKRMQERIADPDGLPIVMRTHHDAGDDTALVVGRIMDVDVDEAGVAKYKAALYDTTAGRDIATLISGQQPAVRSTSIHGYWLGPVRKVQHAGETVDTADDLEVNSIDFTARPGVTGAVLDIGAPRTTRESAAPARTPIAESWDTGDIAEEADGGKKPYGDVQYADPGYQLDKKKRYPLDTADHIKAAWSYVNQKANAAKYSPKQLARIKQKIKAAMKRIGANVSDETQTRVGEIREYYPEGPDGRAGFCVDAYNGPLSITMRGCSIDPADLRVITMAAMTAACDALAAMDPDADGDIDVGTTTEDAEPDDDAEETTTTPAAVPVSAIETTPTPGASTDTTPEEVPAVSEAQQNAAATTAAPTGRTLSDADITALGAVFAQALKENAPAPTAPAVVPAPAPATTTSETANPTAESTTKANPGDALKETVDAAVTAAKAEMQEAFTAQLAAQRDTLRAELLKENGLPGRQGYRVHENDNPTGEPSIDTLFANRADALLGDFGRTPVPIPGTGTAAPAPAGAAQ